MSCLCSSCGPKSVDVVFHFVSFFSAKLTRPPPIARGSRLQSDQDSKIITGSWCKPTRCLEARLDNAGGGGKLSLYTEAPNESCLLCMWADVFKHTLTTDRQNRDFCISTKLHPRETTAPVISSQTAKAMPWDQERVLDSLILLSSSR